MIIDWISDFFHWWTTARVASAAAVGGVGMAAVTGTTAVRTLRHSRRATQRTTRPMMIASLQPSGTKVAGLTVSNAGPSIARNVSVSFDPPLPEHEKTSEGETSILPWIRRRYSKPIPAWAPGYTARNSFLIVGDQRDEHGRAVNIDGISRDTEIIFEYQDDDGNCYSDRFSLDPTLLEGETWSVSKRISGGKETILHDGSPSLAN
ncbi:hypothetical protein [Nocardia sp. NPDC003963]